MLCDAGSVRRTTSGVLTAAGRCAVVAATRLVRSRFTTAASASTTGAVTSSARPAPRSSRSTDVADYQLNCPECPSWPAFDTDVIVKFVALY